jgi:hypothetical protein
MARKASRRKFATMTCPVKGCTHALASKPGTVPGVKRHVRAAHGDRAVSRIQWPPSFEQSAGQKVAAALRKGTSVKAAELDQLSVQELRSKAKQKGIKTAGLKKKELVSALS